MKGDGMQLHKRQTIEQVRLLFDWYEQGLVSRTEAEEKLGIKRRRFFELLKLYQNWIFWILSHNFLN